MTRMSPWCAAAAAAAALSLAACGGPAASTPSAPSATGPASQSGATHQASTAAQTGTTTASCATVKGRLVSTARQLKDALKAASPGVSIVLAPGVYKGHFEGIASGTKARPVTLCGPRSAVLDGGSIKTGYTLHLESANWWKVEGFTIEGGQKGLVTDTSDHDLIYGLDVHSVGDEGIHLRDFSSYDTVSHNVVSQTGRYESYYGEGIYIGSAHTNWCRYSACKADGSDHDTIVGNSISYTTAENIDVKEGTIGGVIIGNHFNGTGMDPRSANSWVNVKGNNWKIIGNVGARSVQDGLSNHQVYAGWGLDNVFSGNKLTVDGPGYGIYISGKRLHADVSCNNKAIGAARGLSSINCTPS
jgi:hypothetical protein